MTAPSSWSMLYCASWDLNCDPLSLLLQKRTTCSVLDSTNVTTYYDPVMSGDVTVDNVTGLIWKTGNEDQSGSDCTTGAVTAMNWSAALRSEGSHDPG